MAAAAAGGAAPAAAVPAAITVPPAFKKLVVIVAGMFYAGQCPPAWWVDAADPKKDAPDAEHAMFQQEKKAAQIAREVKRKAQQDTTGLGVILLTILTEEQWVEEDDVARRLNLPPKMVRKALRYLEQEQLLRREHRKETKTFRKQEREMQIKAGLRPGSGAAAAGGGGDPAAAAAGLGADEDDGIVARGLIVSYCALDYPRIVDSVRWRLATIRKNLQLELKANNAVQKYRCPQAQCGKQYTSMDVWQMVPRDNVGTGRKELCCAICGTDVVMVLDEGGKQLGTMEDKKERKKKARHLLDTMDSALAPLQTQLDAVVNINAPDLLSYAGWMANQAALKQRMDALEKEKGRGGSSGSKRKAPEVYDMNTQVVVSFADTRGADGADTDAAQPGAGRAPAAAGAAGDGNVHAAAAAAAAARGGAPAAPQASSVPPWMAKSTAAAQQQKGPAKVIPPWLVSKHKEAAVAAAGSVSAATTATTMQQQQQQPGFGASLGAIKGEPGGLKADPGVKLEGVMAEPSFKPDPGLKQEPDFGDEDDEWQDVPGAAGVSSAAGVTAAGSSQGGGSLMSAVLEEEDDMEEWEDV